MPSCYMALFFITGDTRANQESTAKVRKKREIKEAGDERI